MKSPKVIIIPPIVGVLKIELDAYYDHRGYNFEGYNKSTYPYLHPFFKRNRFGIDSFSRSTKGVLRGFHGDIKTHKLIQVLWGKIQFAMIDMRKKSPTFHAAISFILSADRPCQIMVPAGVVNAHLCLSDNCIFSYKLSHPYILQENQIHEPWYSSYFQHWEIDRPILSERDEV